MRCVIIGGAEINNTEAVKKYLRPDDCIICCDSGLYNANKLGVTPALIVGDFDSHPKPCTDTETIVLPCEKDDTDTVYAVKEALSRGFDDFLILGAAGGRLDHTLGNVSILLFLFEKGKNALLADDFSDMEIVGREEKYISRDYSYFSLISICGAARGVTVAGAKYPLENACIGSTYQYGISNEVKGSFASAGVRDGRLLLIRVR